VRYEVRVTEDAVRSLNQLPKRVRVRCWAEIKLLADRPRPASSGTLQGKLRGLRRIRIGDYRIAYRVDDSSSVVVVHWAGHRSRIYEEIGRRTQS